MTLNEAMFSYKTDMWETPQDFYDYLNREFNFTLDPCCTEENKKCDTYYTKEDDGLIQDWGGNTVFMNPPTEEKFINGLRKHMKNLKKKIQQSFV